MTLMSNWKPEDVIEVVRYGLMEYGGFTRFQELSGEQRQSMYVQERGNYVPRSCR